MSTTDVCVPEGCDHTIIIAKRLRIHLNKYYGHMISKNTLTIDSYEKLFRSLYLETGDSILFVYADLKIIEANERTLEIFNITDQDLLGMDCRDLIAPAKRHTLDQAIKQLKDYESWAGESSGLRSDAEVFPVEITLKRVPLKDRTLFCIVIRDLTEYKILKELLRQEKSHRREMYITLKNLMKAFEREKSGMETGVSHKVETLLLPTIEKIKKEPSVDIRNTFLNIMQDQLINLTRGFSRELDGRFLTLTRTELRICKHIRTGYSSKEIAKAMHVSFETIQAHRRNIRKKLDLSGRKINLYAFLSTKSFFRNSQPG